MEHQSPKEFYNEEITRLYHGKEREGNKFDNILFVVVSGSLVLSIPPTISMVNGEGIQSAWIIIVSWITLVFSIISIIVNYFVVSEDFKIRIDRLVEFKNSGLVGLYDPKNSWGEAVNVINKISFISWIIAVVFMTIFFCINIL
jgi:hypothetical protein